MKPLPAIESAAKREGVKLTDIGPAMGKAASYFNSCKSQSRTPAADNYARMAEAVGYGLYLMPPEDAPESAIRVDPAE